MRSAIEDIMYGRGRVDSLTPTQAMRDAAETESDCEDELLEKLKDVPDGEKALKEFIEATEKRWLLECSSYYQSGFRLAFRLAFDLLGDCEKN